MSTAVTTVRAHPDKYEKNFDAIVTFLSQYINRKAQIPSVKVASVNQRRPTKWQNTSVLHGTFKGKIELKKYSIDHKIIISFTTFMAKFYSWKF